MTRPEPTLAQALFPRLVSETSRPPRSQRKAPSDSWLALPKPLSPAEQQYRERFRASLRELARRAGTAQIDARLQKERGR